MLSKGEVILPLTIDFEDEYKKDNWFQESVYRCLVVAEKIPFKVVQKKNENQVLSNEQNQVFLKDFINKITAECVVNVVKVKDDAKKIGPTESYRSEICWKENYVKVMDNLDQMFLEYKLSDLEKDETYKQTYGEEIIGCVKKSSERLGPPLTTNFKEVEDTNSNWKIFSQNVDDLRILPGKEQTENKDKEYKN